MRRSVEPTIDAVDLATGPLNFEGGESTDYPYYSLAGSTTEHATGAITEPLLFSNPAADLSDFRWNDYFDGIDTDISGAGIEP